VIEAANHGINLSEADYANDMTATGCDHGAKWAKPVPVTMKKRITGFAIPSGSRPIITIPSTIPLPHNSPVNDEEGCAADSGCKNGVQTWYCEGNGPHPE
jgi:hypothetical protein